MKYFRNSVLVPVLLIGFVLLLIVGSIEMVFLAVSGLFGRFYEARVSSTLILDPVYTLIGDAMSRVDWWAANPPLGYFINDPRVKK